VRASVIDADAVFGDAQRPSEPCRRWVRRARGLDPPGCLRDDDRERAPAARRDRSSTSARRSRSWPRTWRPRPASRSRSMPVCRERPIALKKRAGTA